MIYDKILYGKDFTHTQVVSIEAQDGYLELFKELPNGTIKTEAIPNLYWILSHKQFNSSWLQLKGNLHYKYGKQFDSREEFGRVRGFLRKEDVYSIYDPKEASMVNRGITYFKEMKIEDVSVLFLDIETSGLNPNNKDAQIFLISLVYRNKFEKKSMLLCYDDFNSQEEMLSEFVNIVNKFNPSVIGGHNIVGFDLPYIDTMAKKEGISINIGRDGAAMTFDKYESKFRKEGTQHIHYHKPRIYGREIVDTFFLAIKHDMASRKYVSYGLKPIIKAEGLEDKNRVFYDASQIRNNYKNPVEWKKIKEYCKADAEDSLKLYNLMAPAFFYITQMIPKSFQSVVESASGSQLNALMVRSYLQDAHSIPKTSEVYNFQGAISLGNPGIYKNVLSFDVASLYPSIMVEYQVCDREKDPKEYLLHLVKTLREKRLEYKRLHKETRDLYYKSMDDALKILLNSMYGFCAAPGLNFNAINQASFITSKGREILTKAMEWINQKS